MIMDNIPEVTALDLSNNKLNSMSLEAFTNFKTKVEGLLLPLLQSYYSSHFSYYY